MRSVLAFVGAASAAFLACTALSRAGAGSLAAIALAIGLAFVLVVFASLVWRALEYLLLVRSLEAISVPAVQAGVPVKELTGASSPFVAGFGRPVIYSPVSLSEKLSGDELRAVLLHEERHVADLAPVRLLVVSVIVSLLPLPSVRAWADARQARLEIEADQYAIAQGATRRTLASALLKLAGAADRGTPAFTSSSDLRLRALLGEASPHASLHMPGLRPAIGGLLLALGCLALLPM